MHVTPHHPTKSIIFYFQVHQPRRLRNFQFFDIGSHDEYFDDRLNEKILTSIATDCYVPTNTMLLNLIKHHPEVKICFSISGITLDQFEKYTPEVIESFKLLAQTGSVEFLSETHYHSLACMISEEEFQMQIFQHAEKIHHHFGLRTNVLRNTDLLYNDQIGGVAAKLGFRGILCDGVRQVLNSKGPHHIYKHPTEKDLRILVRNKPLSDDIVLRFGAGKSQLTVDHYIKSLCNMPTEDSIILVGMKYEKFGGHQKIETGKMDFLHDLLTKIIKDKKLTSALPTEVLHANDSATELSIGDSLSLSDERKGVSDWLGNDMQKEAFSALKGLELKVKKTSDEELIHMWRLLQTSEHFYYMSTNKLSERSFDAYFSHFASPHEAFINYMNIISDLAIRIKKAPLQTGLDRQAKALEHERQHSSAPLWAVKKEGHHKSVL